MGYQTKIAVSGVKNYLWDFVQEDQRSKRKKNRLFSFLLSAHHNEMTRHNCWNTTHHGCKIRRETKLELTWKPLLCWLVFIMPAGTSFDAGGEKVLMILTYELQYQPANKNIPTSTWLLWIWPTTLRLNLKPIHTVVPSLCWLGCGQVLHCLLEFPIIIELQLS